MTEKIVGAAVDSAEAKPARRRFLGTAASGIAGAAAMAAPMVSVAQSPIVLKMQGAWGAKDIFNEMAEEYVKRVNEMAGGRAAHRLPGGRRGGQAVRGDGRHQQGRARRLPRRAGVLVRQEQGGVAVRLGPDQRLRRAADAGLDLSRRRPRALQRAAQEDQPRRRRLLRDADADAAAGLVQEADHAGLGAQGPEVPHRRPGGRPVPGDGRQGHAAARRRNHPGAGEGRDRRLRVQQSDLRHALRRAGRDQELHDGQLPPGDGVLRDRLQQEEVRLAARKTCRRSCSTRSRRPSSSNWWTAMDNYSQAICRSCRASTRST